VTLLFSDAIHGTLIWPGGTVPIQRFNILPNGLNLTEQANQPENGWWWNPNESGRGCQDLYGTTPRKASTTVSIVFLTRLASAHP